ncbi:hypothetical protein QBC37DRAFT_405693 [Rhypophila decipiens]|uniref:Uncharacterized protein n=1 Tax=Rhypophila decipiens TaxID=261697 RepID=A0AAN7B0B8_9PEZI|nr:hypothetical protein QBC37DRAFT_405693 [Rhypophila decipiens]
MQSRWTQEVEISPSTAPLSSLLHLFFPLSNKVPEKQSLTSSPWLEQTPTSLTLLPRIGFVYSSRPRVLLNDQHDSQVLRGLVQVTGRTFLQRSDRARVDRVLVLVFDHLSSNPPADDVIGWLDNATWESETSPAIKASQVNDLHALWHAVRQFRRVADAAFNSDIITIAATVNPRSYFTSAVDFPSCFPGNTNLLTWGNTPSSEETKAPQEQPESQPADESVQDEAKGDETRAV